MQASGAPSDPLGICPRRARQSGHQVKKGSASKRGLGSTPSRCQERNYSLSRAVRPNAGSKRLRGDGCDQRCFIDAFPNEVSEQSTNCHTVGGCQAGHIRRESLHRVRSLALETQRKKGPHATPCHPLDCASTSSERGNSYSGFSLTSQQHTQKFSRACVDHCGAKGRALLEQFPSGLRLRASPEDAWP